MYCSSCGVAVAQGLSYCNYCGAKLSGERGNDASKSPEVKPELLAAGMAFVFVFGLVAIMFLMVAMKEAVNLNVGLIIAFTLLSFLTMLLVEGVFIWLLLRRKRGAVDPVDTAPSKEEPTTKELNEARAQGLPEDRTSVTEYTTRALGRVYSERKSKG
jgi:hypothetical protein